MLRYIEKIPIEAYVQKLPNAGSTEVAPMPKARRSVTDVIVIATPACFIANPIRSCKSSLKSSTTFNIHIILEGFMQILIASIRKILIIDDPKYCHTIPTIFFQLLDISKTLNNHKHIINSYA